MDSDINSNSTFYEDLDTNFESAYKMSEQSFSHETLKTLLNNGTIQEKQLAALNFDYVENEDDAFALLNNLTGCDGKIREAIAFKINSILINVPGSRQIFSNISAKVFAAATIDINANICRLVVDSSSLLIEYQNFSDEYTKQIIEYIYEALKELDKFIFKDKKYTINKQLFKLYWSLEALSNFYMFVKDEILEDIISKCANQTEYTIREKTAQIIVNSNKFESIREKLKNDENYYVRQILH